MEFALIGLGYWGPNLLRVLHSMNILKYAIDLDKTKLDKFIAMPTYNNISFMDNDDTLYNDPDITGIFIATPPNTHYKIAKKAIEQGKHVFIEKPLTLFYDEAKELVSLAKAKNVILMVGHIFLYTEEIKKLKELISSKDFGDIHYAYIKRLNLGQIQYPANVIDDLFPHDIATLQYLFNERCVEVMTTAKAHIVSGIEDVAFISLKFESGKIAHLHLSWLDPLKVRDTIVVGTKQMAVCNSLSKEVTLYNKTVDTSKLSNEISGSYIRQLLTYKYGDVIIPYIKSSEPLLEECKSFINSIETNTPPISDGKLGAQVVKVLEAAQRSKNTGIWEVV